MHLLYYRMQILVREFVVQGNSERNEMAQNS